MATLSAWTFNALQGAAGALEQLNRDFLINLHDEVFCEGACEHALRP